MSGDEKFCLRWNDFESNMSVAFREIREEKDFFDCTLSCGSRQIQAHKLILSSCSPFFRTILKQNPHQHPLLYLKGVEFTDLQAVLNFMYHGEVNVAQEELNSFLAVAEDLQVKGLTQNTSNKTSESKQTSSSSILTSRQPKPISQPAFQHDRPTAAPPRPAYQAPPIKPAVPVVKTEPECPLVSYAPPTEEVQGGLVGVENMEEGFAEGGFEYEGYEGDQYGYQEGQGVDLDTGGDEENLDSNIIEDPNGQGFSCGLCGKGLGPQKNNCRRHIKNVHSKSSANLFCEFCQKRYKNYDTLSSHQRASHGVYRQ